MDVSKFNREVLKDKNCPDCGGILQATYYGCFCTECGAMFNDKLQPVKLDDIV